MENSWTKVSGWFWVAGVAAMCCGVLGGCGGDGTSAEEVELTVEPYDFKSRAPWYQCPTKPFDEALTTVTIFDSVHHYFTSWDEGEYQRAAEQQVELPAEGRWQQVGLWLELSCPSGGDCDHWDRLGTLEMALDPEADEPEYMEVARFITPFGIGACQFVDVTPLAGQFAGTQTFKSFIDTWVGPGNSQGEGWELTAKLVYFPGPDDATPEALSFWSMKEVVVGEIGEGNAVADQIEPITVSIPADATKVEARLVSTGHSFGNTLNCAEFCDLDHLLTVNGVTHERSPWRRDCGNNPVQPQTGTWFHNRLGWCPGAVANPMKIDLTDDVTPGGDATISLDILLPNGTEYVNTDPVDWKPNVRLTLQLLIYR